MLSQMLPLPLLFHHHHHPPPLPLWRCACWLQSRQSSQSLGSGQRIYSGARSWTAGEDSKPPPSTPPTPELTLFHLLCKKEEKGKEKALLITVSSSLDMKISHCAGSWWLPFVLRISFFFSFWCRQEQKTERRRCVGKQGSKRFYSFNINGK